MAHRRRTDRRGPRASTHLAAFLIAALLSGAAPAAFAAAAGDKAAGDKAGVPVTVARAVRRNVPVLLRNIGAVQAFQSVLVRPRVDGTIDKVLFTEGQEVKPGDVLVQIDPRPYAAVLAAAQAKRAADRAQLVNAQRDFGRYQSLAKSNFASRQQMDTQAASVAQLTATVQGDDAAMSTAQLNLDFTTIRSPIEGRVGLRLVDAGNLVHATDAAGLVTITQIHPIAVIFTLPQEDLPAIQAAMARGTLPVQAYSADDRAPLDAGQLATIDNAIDPATGSIKLKAVFANPRSRLWPGQFVNARLQIAVLDNAETVPSAAVQHGPDGLYVFVVKPDATVALAPVGVTQDDGSIAVIAHGLADGAQVVVAGQSRLRAGAKVAATPARPNT